MTDAPPTQNPRLPADHGLPALGLLAQVQAVFVPLYATLVIFTLMLRSRDVGTRGAIIGLLALGAIRAAVHFNAGQALTARSPLIFAAVRRYIIVAAVTTAAYAGLLAATLDGVSLGGYAALFVLCLAWPVTLGLLVFRKSVRASFVAADTFDVSLVPGDRSVEGVGVLMTLLAAIGVGTAAIGLVFILELPLDGVDAILLLLLVVLLLVRALTHLDGGIRAIRGVTPEAFSRLVGRYLGLALATVGALALFLVIASHGRGLALLVVVVLLLAGMLLAWPLVLRRFANQVARDDVGDADTAPFGPALDRGLTAFGYMLAVIGTSQAAFVIASVLVGVDAGALLSQLGAAGLGSIDPMQLLSLGSAAVTLWAAREAITMSDRRQLAIYVYAAVTVGTAAINWATDGFPLAGTLDASAPPAAMVLIALQLVVPLTGVVLVRRRLPPPIEATPPRGLPAVE